MRTLRICVFALLAVLSWSSLSFAAEAALSNEDVVKLVKLGFGDDVVIGKIKQAEDAKFDLTTDGLVALKEAGVSGAVIAAMLDRGNSNNRTESAGMTSAGALDPHGQDIRMLVDGREISLVGARGDFTTTGFYPVYMSFLDYPGLHANTRTAETKPAFLIRSPHDPANYYFIGKLDVNDGENNRSLKIMQKGGAFSMTSRVVPAKSWEVPYEASQEAPGVWRITPTTSLERGEYGIVITGGILYEFGVD